MFGFLFGAGKIDSYRADMIHTYLGTFHRVHEKLGFDSLIRTIQANPNIVFKIRVNSKPSGFRAISMTSSSSCQT